MSKGLSRKDIERIDEFFQTCKPLTYIFLALKRGVVEACSLGPDFASAVDLAIGAVNDIGYTAQDRDTPAEAAGRYEPWDRSKTVRKVQERLKELRASPRWSFILVWNMRGDDEAYLDYSEDLEDRVSEEIRCYLESELYGCVP
jgi:hypothetical protein